MYRCDRIQPIVFILDKSLSNTYEGHRRKVGISIAARRTVGNNSHRARKKRGFAAATVVNSNIRELLAQTLVGIEKIVRIPLREHTVSSKNIPHDILHMAMPS